jgi:bHLH-MYC and R2R3-MYB transcription factors N-terminal
MADDLLFYDVRSHPFRSLPLPWGFQRCVPHGLIAKKVSGSLVATQPNEVACPCCYAPVTGLYLYPMVLSDLDRAVDLRRQAAGAASHPGGKRPADATSEEELSFLATQAEASYLLLSHSSTGGSSSLADSSDYQRTGRWTDQETALVDCLIHSFDKGQLPVPEGMRLNDFLRDLLLCKSSRLTKKMKHAKLSSRCYEILDAPGFNPRVFSALEDEFLKSVASVPSRLELRFNFTKVWRTAVSNLCVQVGSPLLIPDDWMESLERMEKKAIEAEEVIRAARRHRMGLALKTDLRSSQSGVFFSGVSFQRPEPQSKKPKLGASDAQVGGGGSGGSSSGSTALQHRASVPSEDIVPSTAFSDGDADFIAAMLDMDSGLRTRSNSFEDFTKVLNDLTDDPLPGLFKNNCGPFLEAIMALVEGQNLPFEHVDVWVPSADPTAVLHGSGGSEGTLRLYHAGFLTRHDLDPGLTRQLEEYGEYSTKFSFAVGSGLPGRVFQAGGHSWERHIDEADPKIFERAGGARVYGIKTGLGIGLNTNVIGRMVVGLYSVHDLPEDSAVVQTCINEFAKLSPEPKWTLVVDMGSSNLSTTKGRARGESLGRTPAIPSTFPSLPTIDHYHHSVSGLTHTERSQSSPALEEQPSSGGGHGLSPRTLSSECQLAMLLGDHIPMGDEPFKASTTPGIPVPSASDFMSLRLLLLRSPERRSEQENELIEIIKKSYEGYSHDQRRTGKDIAHLLVVDWVYLNGSNSRPREPSFDVEECKPRAQSVDQVYPSNAYQSHQMDPTVVSVMNGSPIRQPTLFQGGPGGRGQRGSSFDIVMTDMNPRPSSMGMVSTHNVCIVDDNSEENTYSSSG